MDKYKKVDISTSSATLSNNCTEFNKMNLKINEFCTKGDLESYREIIYKIFNQIEEAGCKINAIYNSNSSVHETINNKSCHIQISLKCKYKKPIHIIWTIFHELGHHTKPIKKENENNIILLIESEKKAWDYAYKQVNKYPELLSNVSDFNEFKEEGLRSYLKK
jgi:hypothetical protein